MDDQQLISQIKQGNIAAFEELVKKYQSKLIHFTARYVDIADAQDIAQNTFIKIYQNIHKIDTDKKFSTYMFTIAKNEAFSFLRKHKREVPLDELIIDNDSPVGELKIEESGLGNAVDKLDKKYKKVIKMYYFDELQYDQIAAALKLPVNTIRTHLKRAKAALKKTWRP